MIVIVSTRGADTPVGPSENKLEQAAFQLLAKGIQKVYLILTRGIAQ